MFFELKDKQVSFFTKNHCAARVSMIRENQLSKEKDPPSLHL